MKVQKMKVVYNYPNADKYYPYNPNNTTGMSYISGEKTLYCHSCNVQIDVNNEKLWKFMWTL